MQTETMPTTPPSQNTSTFGLVVWRRKGLLARLLAWDARYRSRVQLESLPKAVLDDMGMSDADVMVEVRRFFWQV